MKFGMIGTASIALAAATPSFADVASAAGWAVRPAESTLGFTAKQQGAEFKGVFERWTADIAFDPDALATSKVTVRVETGSFNSKSADRDSEVPGKAWFDVKGFPEAVFEATTFEKTGEGSYVAKGTLTLKGVSKPVDLPFTLAIEGGVARMAGSASLNRTEFNVGSGSWKDPASVGHEVKIDVAVVADRQ